MKMNMKVRLKNPVFWITFLPTLIGFVYSILSMFNITPSITEEHTVTVLSAVVSGLASFGILVDPTTKGVCDSKDALNYNEPK